MAAFPTVKYAWQGLSEDPKPVVERVEMERGLAKQRRINSDTVVTESLDIYFDTLAEAAAFETWFFVTIKGGQDYFDFTSLRSGGTVQARVVGGKLGALKTINRNFTRSMRTIVIEWTVATL